MNCTPRIARATIASVSAGGPTEYWWRRWSFVSLVGVLLLEKTGSIEIDERKIQPGGELSDRS
jgi:hypothetical protein